MLTHTPETSPRLINTAADDRYYSRCRFDLLALLPTPLGRVLDVGCGAGASARAARAQGASTVDGIEIVEKYATRAKDHMDVVHIGAVEEVVPTLTSLYDTILCLDVLEHLVNPYLVLRALHSVTRRGGVIQVSVPNARQKSLVLDLVIRGTFGYADSGHRDWTHLRWFTRLDLRHALQSAGWEIMGDGTSDPGPRGRLLGRAFGPRVHDFFATQIYMTARTSDEPAITRRSI